MTHTKLAAMPRASAIKLTIRACFDSRVASARFPLSMAERHCTDLETDSVLLT